MKSLFVNHGRYCRSCPGFGFCPISATSRACEFPWGDHRGGGVHALHPVHPFAVDWWEATSPNTMFDIVPDPTPLIPFHSTYTPQVRPRTALRGLLVEPVYIVRADNVLLKRGVRPAMHLRQMIGMSQRQLLGVSFHVHDSVLERLWRMGAAGLDEIANAGYDFAIAPSYSLWRGRSPFEWLINQARSMRVFESLQQRGIPAIPNAFLGQPEHMELFAQWCATNPQTGTVALDLQTVRGHTIEQDIQLISRLETVTEGRLSYLVNGPTSPNTISRLAHVVDPGRLHFTSTTLAAPFQRLASDEVVNAPRIEDPLRFLDRVDAYRTSVWSGLSRSAGSTD